MTKQQQQLIECGQCEYILRKLGCDHFIFQQQPQQQQRNEIKSKMRMKIEFQIDFNISMF